MKEGMNERGVDGDGVCDCSLDELRIQTTRNLSDLFIYLFKHVLKNNFVLFILRVSFMCMFVLFRSKFQIIHIMLSMQRPA